MTVNITLVGREELMAKFSAMPKTVHQSLLASMYKIGIDLETYIKQNKLLGQVLNKRSGRLQSSIHNQVQDASQMITTRVFSAGPLPYAGIHEYGGTIRAHIVEAKNAQALRFMFKGKITYAKSVQIPAIKMPERSFMRSGLEDSRTKITAELQAAVTKGIKG